MSTFAYPLAVLNGSLVLTSDYTRVVPEVIAHILQTKLEERVLQPDFGISDVEFNNLYDLPRLLRELEESLRFGLQDYPGVSYRLVGYADDSGSIPVTCYYAIDETNGTLTVIL